METRDQAEALLHGAEKAIEDLGDKADEADLPNLIFNLVFEFNVFSEFNKCEIIVGTTENQVT